MSRRRSYIRGLRHRSSPRSLTDASTVVDENSRSFHYDDIQEGRGFRILNLQPAASLDDEIVCTLTTVDLDDYPLFEALSYVWGTEWSDKPLRLEGITFKITANLDVALRYLRRSNEVRLIWVDALCIDQANVDERRVHVQYMKEIYARCTTDLLWLGDDGDMLVNASGAFKKFGTAVNAFKNGESAEKLGQQDGRDLLGVFVIPDIWHRVWIMQEVSFAANVVLIAGYKEMPWLEVEEFLEVNDSVVKYGVPDAFHAPRSHDFRSRAVLNECLSNPQIVAQQRTMIKAKNEVAFSPLMDVLARFRFTNATDARDKIYALLGLASDRLGIEPDYMRSVRDTYIVCSKILMEKKGNLDLICQGPWQLFGNEKRRTDLPSWVPDYSTPGDSLILFAQRGVYDAGEALESTSLKITATGSLILSGVSLGTFKLVRALHPITLQESSHLLGPLDDSFYGAYKIFSWMPDSLLRKLIGRGSSWLNKYLSSDISDGSDDLETTDEFDKYWRTLTLDCERYPVHRLSSPEISNLRLLFNTMVSETQTQAEDSRLGGELYRLLGRILQKWTFAVSSKGVFCMASPDVQVGDCIVVVDGAKVPLVLRPSQTAPEAYTYIGSCYVHEFMDGQGYHLPNIESSKRQFEIV